MPTVYEIVDLRPGGESQTVEGKSPVAVVAKALGEPVVRSGAPRNLVAKCYFDNGEGGRNMVRFYRTVETEARLEGESANHAA